jgi:hypothetical protein
MLLAGLFLPVAQWRSLRAASAVPLVSALALIVPSFGQLRRHGEARFRAGDMETARVVERGLCAVVEHPPSRRPIVRARPAGRRRAP